EHARLGGPVLARLHIIADPIRADGLGMGGREHQRQGGAPERAGHRGSVAARHVELGWLLPGRPGPGRPASTTPERSFQFAGVLIALDVASPSVVGKQPEMRDRSSLAYWCLPRRHHFAGEDLK